MIFIFYSALRKEERIQSLVDGETYENLCFHQKCLDRYVHPKALKRFEEDQNS